MEKNSNYEKLWDLIKEDDLDFYEKFLDELSEEEFENFMKENPDFLVEN